jgi:serine/threonine protein kinase
VVLLLQLLIQKLLECKPAERLGVLMPSLPPMRCPAQCGTLTLARTCVLQDLIQKLLERKPAKRLGMLSGKAQDVKRHRWFEGMDWAALEARRSAPPRRPKVGSHNMLTWTVTTCWTDSVETAALGLMLRLGTARCRADDLAWTGQH